MAEHEHPHPDLGGYVLGALEPEEARAFEAHLGSCELCRREVAELSELPELLAQAAPPVEVPAYLEERTFAAVERAVGEDQDAPRVRRGRPPRRVELRKVLAVAAAVVLVGTGAAVVRQASRPQAAAAQVVELEAPAGRSGQAVARVRVGPDGGVIEMEVDQLSPPPPGFFFECWLVSPEGDTLERPNRVSVGTFTVDEHGRARVRWDFRADTTKFSRMGVTLEPADGNPLHTTDRVLAAKRLL